MNSSIPKDIEWKDITDFLKKTSSGLQNQDRKQSFSFVANVLQFETNAHFIVDDYYIVICYCRNCSHIFSFVDVVEMAEGQMVMKPNYTLQETMSATEVSYFNMGIPKFIEKRKEKSLHLRCLFFHRSWMLAWIVA
jgi:hypothetical protein